MPNRFTLLLVAVAETEFVKDADECMLILSVAPVCLSKCLAIGNMSM